MSDLNITGTRVAWVTEAYGVRQGRVKGLSPNGKVVCVTLLGNLPKGLTREVYATRRQLKVVK